MPTMHARARFSALVVIMTAALSITACGAGINSPSTGEPESLVPAASLAPGLSPTPSLASPSSSIPGGGIGPDSLARVVTNDLVVRSLPEISDRSTIDPILLQVGQLLFVLQGPVLGNGYDWYRVAPFSPCCPDVVEPTPLLGWVAAGGRDGEPWIQATTEECAFVNPVGNPDWQPDLLALACLGDREIVFQGTLNWCASNASGDVEPLWLAENYCGLLPDGFEQPELGPQFLPFHVGPDGPALPDQDASIRIAGHLDDPAAATCRAVRQTEERPIPPEVVVLRCRAAFVVTEITLT